MSCTGDTSMAGNNDGMGFRPLDDSVVQEYEAEIATLMTDAAISFFDYIQSYTDATEQRAIDEARGVLVSAVRDYVRISIVGGEPFRENRAQLRENVEDALQSYVDRMREIALPSLFAYSEAKKRTLREHHGVMEKFVREFYANRTEPDGITSYLVAKNVVRSYTERHNTFDDPTGIRDSEYINLFVDIALIDRLPVGMSAIRPHARMQDKMYSQGLGSRSAVSVGNALVQVLDHQVRWFIFVELLNMVFYDEQPLYVATPSTSALNSPDFVPYSPSPIPLSPRVPVDTQPRTTHVEVYPGWLQSMMMDHGRIFFDKLDESFLRIADAQRRIKETVMDSVATYSSTPTQLAYDTWRSTADERVGNAYADFVRVLHEAALPEQHNRSAALTPRMRWLRSNRVDAVTNGVISYVKDYEIGRNEVVTAAELHERGHDILHRAMQNIVDTHTARNLHQQAYMMYMYVFQDAFRPGIVEGDRTDANELRYRGGEIVYLTALNIQQQLLRAAYTYVFEKVLVAECFERRHNSDRDMEVWPSIPEPSAHRRGSFSDNDDDMDVDGRDSVERDDDDSSQDDAEKGKERMRDW